MYTFKSHEGLERGHSELSSDINNEGTSARTRPFSCEDIMLRRRNRKVVVRIQDAHGEGDEGEQIFEKASYDSGSERDRRDTTGSIISKDALFDRRESSRRKDVNTSSFRKSDLVKDKTEESRDGTKTMSNSVMKNHTRVGKSDRYTESGEGRSSHYSKDRSDERHMRDLGGKNASPSKSTRKYKKDRDSQEHTNYDDVDGNKKRNVDQISRDYEGKLKKRHSRDWISTDGHWDIDTRQLDKAPKKRHEDDFQLKEGDRKVKKPQLRSSIVSDSLERSRKDTLQRNNEEPSQKRERSRSRGPDDERKQPSHSSRDHRRSSVGNQERRVSPSRSLKDKSEKAHHELERKRGSTNGANGNYRRYSGHSSGLGGYSPRKRKTDAAPRTPSSTHHSPEKRDAGWEVKPLGKDADVTGPVASDISSSQIVSATENKSLDVTPKVAVPFGPTISYPLISSSNVNAIDSIQLTQATRPKRRLYVENLPFPTSEKALMEWINNFLLSSGVNHIHGTLPCISCIIHQDKGQALLEFLTPEDASAALSFDGRAFSGSMLKIRRPKDFIEVTTGGDKSTSTEVAYSISDAVENSSNKIFIGGISKLISSEMLMQIAKIFGPLKAFHFEHSTEIAAQVAFLEYADHLVTLKACAGLNGMKLGGQVLTVVQAFPDNIQRRNDGHLPLYGIPENAKPLMEKPTEVLKLKNVLDPVQLSSLSQVEVEEILEDIRLECTRFGAIKAVNIVKSYSSATATCAATDVNLPMDQDVPCQEVMLETRQDELGGFDTSNTLRKTTEPAQDNINLDDKPSTDNTLSSPIQPDESDKTEVSNAISSDKLPMDLVKDEIDESLLQDEVSEDVIAGCDEKTSLLSPHASRDQLLEEDEVSVASLIKAPEAPNEENVEDSQSGESTKLPSDTKLVTGEKNELETFERVEKNEETTFCGVLEVGCIIVEFKRAEASCTAAHCLHGRLFSDRIVSVEYVPVDLYQKSFAK